ncbi:hypothetical protein Brms1b_012622 [Colletotrichum noveboracense]|nr:hypothetical protein Brms1b_012622 [Colletotrichum noveboracense]
MASLIPVKESDISIVYNSNTRELVLAAKGEIPKVFLTPFFKQESVLNTGLTFSIRAFAGGFPPQKGEKSFEIKHSVHINLPLPHFNNKTVLIETASGNFSVEIKYTGFGPGPVVRGDNGSEEGTTYQDVLPPIKRSSPPSRVNIEPSYNPEFLELIRSTVQEGSISWTFKWKKLPTEEGANPQLIDVTTHQYNGLVGPAARNYITIQGYVVLFVVFEKK